MKNIALLLFFVSLTSWAEGDSQQDQIAYSYFTVGSEQVSYKENIGSINSSADVSNLMINSGGLYDINDTYAFSIDALASFYSDIATETWLQNGYIIQQNDFEYQQASTNVLLHYKLTPSLRLVAGGGFSLMTYTRTGLDLITPNGEVYKSGVIQEKSNEFYLDAGMAYESGNLNKQWRYGVKATMGVPVWTETTNSAYQNMTFEHSGYRANIESNASFRIIDGLHFGVYARVAYMQRDSSDGITYNEGTRIAILPEAETENVSIGAMLLWNL